MRKVIALAVGALLLVSTMAGCTTTDPSKDGVVTLTFWTHVDNVWNAEHDKLIAEFEAANEGIKIKRESFPYDDFEAKAITSLSTKSGGADIYQIWGGWGVDFSSSGAFAPVPEDFIAHILADSYEPVLGSFEYEGKYYGIPLEFNIEYGGMLVDIPMFTEREITYPQTWDEMIDIARKYSKSSGATFEVRGFDFPAWDALTYTWLSMILSAGGQYMDGDQFNFSTPIGIETMQKLVDYVKIDQMTNTDGITNAEEEEPYQRFYHGGTTLMVPRGPWVVPEGPAEYDLTYGVDYEYVAMPFYGSQKIFAAETGWGLAVNAASKNADAAWKFIEFWSEAERMLEFNIAAGMIPATKTIAHDPALLEAMPYLAPLVEILDGGRYIGYFNTDDLKEAVCDMFVDLVNSNITVAAAIADLDARLNG